MSDTRFTPRRLGHVNLWVSDLEKSIRFYEQVCGIELVRRERAIKLGFHSNGNTHHDIGLVEISRGVDRIGRDGTVQIPATRGLEVGLNHLGWEMESEAALVAAYERQCGERDAAPRAVDHLISHSVYVNDPDGNGHEFYADALHDWRSIYNLDQEDEVTGLWDPKAAPPDPTPYYNVDPPLRVMEGAVLHPGFLIGATFATARFDAMAEFLRGVGGLQGEVRGARGQRQASFAGTLGRSDLTLVEVGAQVKTGLQSFAFNTIRPTDADALAARCSEHGVPAPRHETRDGAAWLDLVDPDGYRVSFRAD